MLYQNDELFGHIAGYMDFRRGQLSRKYEGCSFTFYKRNPLRIVSL
jgi:hypothetical protein